MKNCLQCNQLFTPNPKRLNFFCSNKCCKKNEYARRKSGEKITGIKNCVVCSKEFEGMRKQKHCSTRCKSRAYGRKRLGLSIKTLDMTCLVCDKKFTQKRSNNTSFCSRKCKTLAGTRKKRGHSINGPRRVGDWGSGYITASGYRMISKNHPNAKQRTKNGNGQIMEHTWVMSNHIGRPLYKHETVHHKNGIRDDNRLENLELWSHSHPFGQRVEDKIQWCKEFLKEYGYSVTEKI